MDVWPESATGELLVRTFPIHSPPPVPYVEVGAVDNTQPSLADLQSIYIFAWLNVPR